MIPIVRASTPKDFNPIIHTVIKFKKNNDNGDYTRNKDYNLFQYNGVNANYIIFEKKNYYTEEMLLSLSNMTVVEYELK